MAGLLSTGYFLPQILTILGQIFYEAWQLSAVSEETDREAFFSKVFRVYGSVLFCCAAGIVWLCRPLMNIFQQSYFDAWQFVPFLVLSSMCTCLNQFTNSVYVVFKRSFSSLYTMLAGAVLNVILNYFFILWIGPVGVTVASFLSLALVFVLRAYSTRGLLEIDFRPGWMGLNLALVLVEIGLLYFFRNSPSGCVSSPPPSSLPSTSGMCGTWPCCCSAALFPPCAGNKFPAKTYHPIGKRTGKASGLCLFVFAAGCSRFFRFRVQKTPHAARVLPRVVMRAFPFLQCRRYLFPPAMSCRKAAKALGIE